MDPLKEIPKIGTVATADGGQYIILIYTAALQLNCNELKNKKD